MSQRKSHARPHTIDPAFQARLRAVLRVAAEEARGRLERHDTPDASVESVVRKDDEFVRKTVTRQGDVATALLTEALSQRAEEVDRLIDRQSHLRLIAAEAANEAAGVGEDESPIGRIQDLFLDKFVRHYVATHGDLSWADDTFDELYSELEAYLASGVEAATVVAPLENFESPLDVIPLDDDVFVRRVSDAERAFYFEAHGESYLSSLLEPHRLSVWNHAIYVRTDTNHIVFNLEAPAPAADALTALRLYQPGWIGASLFFVTGESRTYSKFGYAYRDIDAPRWPGSAERYCLSESGSAPVLALYTQLARARAALRDAEARRLGFALRRFNIACGRLRPDDQLVDLWMCLETLFAYDVTIETVFRLSTRIARYTETDSARRAARASAVKKLYTTRSSLVHGSAVKLEELAKDLLQTNELVRDVLQRILRTGSVPDATTIDFGI